MAAGMPVPRPPAAIGPGVTAQPVLSGRGGVYDVNGLDVTGEFRRGADLALEVSQEAGCRFALLTDGSPYCGSTFVYGGNFDGQKHTGEGLVAARLRAAGITVCAPHQLRDLADAIEAAEKSG